MNTYWVLMKKQFREWFSFLRKGRKNLDVLGLLTTILLAAVVIWVIIQVFAVFVRTYTKVSFPGNRDDEILTIAYSLVLIFNIFSGLKKIDSSITSGDDLEILVGLPIKSQTLFLSKLTGIFIQQIFNSFLFIFPLNLTFGIITAQGSDFILLSIFVCLILPLISIIISAFLAIPYHYLVKYLKSKFLFLTILFAALISLAFFVYAQILKLIKSLLETGAIKFVFDAKRINYIRNLCKWLFPGRILSEISLGEQVWLNLLILLGLVGSIGVLAFISIRRLFVRVTQGKLENSRFIFQRTKKQKEQPVIRALVRKEFINVLRTPNYSFQYFAVTLTVPLMVYTSITLTSSLVTKSIGLNLNFELTFFIIIIFSVLTNTFCATNISRDGNMFRVLKTLPISHQQIILAKIIFSALVSLISISLTVVIMALYRYVLWWEAIVIFLTTTLISLSEIFFATRKDLNKPRFPKKQNEITESNNTVSLITVLGLLFSLVIGGLTLLSRILTTFRVGFEFGSGMALLIVLAVSLLLFALSLLYLCSGLKKKYYSLEE
jgi:ABC-2 type transport system permease protein